MSVFVSSAGPIAAAQNAERYRIHRWAVSRSDLQAAWFSYTRRDIPDRSKGYAKGNDTFDSSYYGFCRGWIACRGLDPQFNVADVVPPV